MLFTAPTTYGSQDPSSIDVVSLSDHRKTTLLDHAGVYARYLASGQLVYAAKGSLFGRPFDSQRLKVSGAPVILGEVSVNPTLGSAQYDVSQNGTLIYLASLAEELRTIQWLDRTGKMEPVVSQPTLYAYPRLSPDHARLAVIESQDVGSDLVVYDLERSYKTRLTTQMSASYPVWSPDGRFLVFATTGGILWTRSDGATKPQPLTRSKVRQVPNAFSSDGARLVFVEAVPSGGAEILVLPVQSTSDELRAAEPQSFLKTSTVEVYPSFSPDGKWLAYVDAENGTYEVYVRAFPDKGRRWPVSNAGGMVPVWSPNGHELLYRTEDQRIMVVSYAVNRDSFVPEKPRVWSGKQLANLGTGRNYDVGPDGDRCIVLAPVESAEPRQTQSHLNLVVNFLDEVRRRMAVGK